MASFQSIMKKYPSLLVILLNFQTLLALYEDQVGKFDWKRSFIGKVKYAHFDASRIIVGTEENIIASLNMKNGNILWRQLMENPKEQQLMLLHSDRDLLSVSGTMNNWFVRTWDHQTGTLLSEWTIFSDKNIPSVFTVEKGTLLHIFPTQNSHLDVVTYNLDGNNQKNTIKIPAPWITDISNCVLSKSYYICISKNDISGQLYYVNILSEKPKVYIKTLHSVLGDTPDLIEILPFEDIFPAFLLSSNGQAKVIHVDEDVVNTKIFKVMPNAVSNHNGEKPFIYQLEPASNPDKLVQIRVKDYATCQDEMATELEYPVGLGAPIIIATATKNTLTDVLLSTTDNAFMLVRLSDGKIMWTREEALSNIIAVEFFELPVSELDASIENEFKASSNSILSMLSHRLNTQAKQLSTLIFGEHPMSSSGLVRDAFGLHKLIVVATSVGKLFAIDTLSGSIVWSYRLPNVKPFSILGEDKILLFAQRTARYAPLPAQCILIANDKYSGNGVIFQFDPITGYSQKGIEKLNYQIAQAIHLPYEDDQHLKPVLMISSTNEVYLYPSCAMGEVYKYTSKLYTYLVDNTGSFKGYSFIHSTKDKLKMTPSWELQLQPAKLVAVKTKHPNERVHSQGRVLPDRSVYYKYVNPNLIAVATVSDDPVHKHVLSVYLIDGVTGLILYATSHKRSRGPIHLVHSENWIVYSYFNERFRRTEFAAAELYEGHVQSNSSVFSSFAVSLLPHVQTQSYILPATPLSVTVTLTERGITNKFLLAGLSGGGVIEIPWLLLQPRLNDIPCSPEESCIPYMPEIPLPSEAVINYNQTIGRIDGIEVAPARLESTSHILVHGIDLFYTKVAPSKTFDMLKEDFDHMMIILVLTGLVISSYLTKYLASKKALKQMWK
ncbi:unnamed protein product [Acanthoscelides obtectus]|uniref:ER membrane protein complex subunit 1 n=1 Tax=Acanthoscelides obtectus TaxID=200917 RepID=A0A9P0LQG7_ACAOB|nr:unnamed protein product [Acanthoscelides obtectus]CAK1650270.1 ER membrane protein complex subunit 1 [Acanthoscelides obtectus]